MAEKAVSFRVVSPGIMITGIETIYDAIYLFFWEKGVSKMHFLPLKYKEKSLKAAKRHLEVELASVFFMAKWCLNSMDLLSNHQFLCQFTDLFHVASRWIIIKLWLCFWLKRCLESIPRCSIEVVSLSNQRIKGRLVMNENIAEFWNLFLLYVNITRYFFFVSFKW